MSLLNTTDVIQVPSPVLPGSTPDYDRLYQDQLLSVLRLYFNQLAASYNSLQIALRRDIDWLQFDTAGGHDATEGQLTWNATDQTFDMGMAYGVVQQVGQETYARVQNSTGSTLPNGTVVGFSGVGIANTLSVSKFIADGSQPSLYVLGVMTHDLTDSGEIGYCTVWGHVRGLNTTGSPVSETWSVGDILYASPTTAGAFTNVKPTAPNNVIPMAAVLAVSSTNGEIFVRPTVEQRKYYGDFVRTTDTSPAVVNTAYAITFDTTNVAEGVSIGSPTSRIVVANSGLYTFSATFQLISSNASATNVWLWWRKNGTDLTRTSFITTLSSNGQYSAVSRSDFFSLAAGDYIEVMWAADSTAITLAAVASTAFAPSSPAVTLTVDQIQQ